jgi:hypothetical protein
MVIVNNNAKRNVVVDNVDVPYQSLMLEVCEQFNNRCITSINYDIHLECLYALNNFGHVGSREYIELLEFLLKELTSNGICSADFTKCRFFYISTAICKYIDINGRNILFACSYDVGKPSSHATIENALIMGANQFIIDNLGKSYIEWLDIPRHVKFADFKTCFGDYAELNDYLINSEHYGYAADLYNLRDWDISHKLFVYIIGDPRKMVGVKFNDMHKHFISVKYEYKISPDILRVLILNGLELSYKQALTALTIMRLPVCEIVDVIPVDVCKILHSMLCKDTDPEVRRELTLKLSKW